MQATPLLVIGLTLAFVVLLNLVLIYIALRSSGSARILSRSIRSLGKPFKEDNQKYDELSELIRKIKQEENGQE
jgi:uncharacterized membrane protein YqiK